MRTKCGLHFVSKQSMFLGEPPHSDSSAPLSYPAPFSDINPFPSFFLLSKNGYHVSKDNFVIQPPLPVSCINPSTPRPAGPLQPLSGRSFEPVHMVCRFRIPEVEVHPLASKKQKQKENF